MDPVALHELGLALLARLRPVAPPSWETLVLYASAVFAWALIAGSRSGGTFWGWWGTWLYLGVLMPALFSPLAILILTATLHWSWLWRILLALVCAFVFVSVFAQRSRIADLAFAHTVCQGRQLSQIHAVPRRVFCGTEMQTGKPVFFSRDFIYTWGAGLGQCADMPLSTAVQASANFPVAFPYRTIPLKKYDFRLGSSDEFYKKRVPSLVVSDGGVYDNTGSSWFLGASEREATLKWYLSSFGSGNPKSPFGSQSIPESVRQRLQEQLSAMEEKPEILIVVNSSFPHVWGATRLQGIPGFGEIAALLRVQAVNYEHGGSEHSLSLLRSFFFGSLPGAMVFIEQDPNWFFAFLDPDYQPELYELGLSDLPANLFERYSRRTRDVWAQDTFGTNATPELVALDDRRRELRKRWFELRAQLRRAPLPQEEETRLKAEIAERRAELSSVHEKLPQPPQKSTDLWERFDETMQSSNMPTTFRPLGVRPTAILLRHGYLNCMKICHLLLEGFPHFNDPPTLDELHQLALGRPRTRYPGASMTVAS